VVSDVPISNIAAPTFRRDDIAAIADFIELLPIGDRHHKAQRGPD
jgi:hypothetical protein